MHAHTHNEVRRGTVGAGTGLGPPPVVLCSIKKKIITDGAWYSHQLRAHEHVHAHGHGHNEIHKGTVGAGTGLGPTPVVLCSIK